MKKLMRRAVALLVIALIGATAGISCDHREEEGGPGALLIIRHLDTDNDGAPDAWRYLIRVRDNGDNELDAKPPMVTVPGGPDLAMTCRTAGDDVVCDTNLRTPGGAGTKADVPVGTYLIFNSSGELNEFYVSAGDLASADPSAADPATLAPAPPTTLPDPAALDWAHDGAGVDGDYWRFSTQNADGADDDGDQVSGSSADWAQSNFTLNLPDNWDSADALIVSIVAGRAVALNYYTLTIEVEVAVTGYTLP